MENIILIEERNNDNNYAYFNGYASIYNVKDNHNDVIYPNCFNAKNILPSNIKILWQHNAEQPIGECVEIEEDEIGLYIKAKIVLSTQKGLEAYKLIKSGVINGLSVGFSILDEISDYESNSRIIKSAKLWEVSLVTFPANEFAYVTNVKNADLNIKSIFRNAIKTLTN